MRALVLPLVLSFPIGLAACDHDHGAEPFDTLQACFDDHTAAGGEALPVQKAITVCCIEHPIAGKLPSCGTTAVECGTIVRAGLSTATTTADITAACADYATQLGM